MPTIYCKDQRDQYIIWDYFKGDMFVCPGTGPKVRSSLRFYFKLPLIKHFYFVKQSKTVDLRVGVNFISIQRHIRNRWFSQCSFIMLLTPPHAVRPNALVQLLNMHQKCSKTQNLHCRRRKTYGVICTFAYFNGIRLIWYQKNSFCTTLK